MIIDKTNSIFLEGKEIIEIKNSEGSIIWKKQTETVIPNYLRFDIPQRKVFGFYEGVIINISNLDLFTEPQYSLDGINFKPCRSQMHLDLDLINPTTIYFRANGMSTNNTKRTFSFQIDTWSRVLPEIQVNGDVRSLLAYEDFENATLTNYCFYGLFSGSQIKTAPELNAMTLASHCYDSMFQSLTGLTTAPELPATTLADFCYEGMFDGSTGLVNPPTILPAESVPSRAYEYMFNGCTNLKTAPEIKAKSISTASCRYMFNNCKSLVNSPELEFTSIGASGCTSMFSNCSELVTPPSELKPTSIGNNTYQGMFDNCTKLESAPDIKATSHGSRSCRYMFNNCTSLTVPPPTLKGAAQECYTYMFNGCTSLEKSPHISGYMSTSMFAQYMFNGCSKLNYIWFDFTIVSSSHLTGWVQGVASSGTFVKPSGLSLSTGTSGIPSGWTVINE